VTFEVEVEGQARTVSLEPAGDADAAGGAFRLFLDGAPHDVVVVRTDLGLVLTFGDGRVVDAAVTPRGHGEWLVQLPRAILSAVVDGRRHTSGGHQASVDGEQRVIAPMPGRVVRVLVRAGDQVTAGQGLVVVEAMKMENELTATRAGTVAEIAVSEGTSVEAGRLLVVIS
jgi:biotin carboxyl carrier protein